MLAGRSLALDHPGIPLKMRKNGRGFEENSQRSRCSRMIPHGINLHYTFPPWSRILYVSQATLYTFSMVPYLQ